ncbi:hypothetical protein ACFLYI_01545 [Chloroflexota bacterium]
MKTLLEFITYTKGVEYLIAIAFLLAFMAFWFLLHRRGKGLVIRIIPLAVLTLGFSVLAFTCALPRAPTATAKPTGETHFLSSAVLVEMYGPATFGHELHQSTTDDCTVCHHRSGDKTPPCKECHEIPFNPDNLNKPGIARVYHLRCISCHRENELGPTECTGCHQKASIPPLSITHPLAGRGNCLSCHETAIPEMPRLPADHNNGVTNDACELCHKSLVEEVALATRALPHGVTGREDCLICHGEGIGGAAKLPADHTGRANDTCQLCH